MGGRKTQEMEGKQVSDIEDYAEDARELADKYSKAFDKTPFHKEMSAELKHSKWVQKPEMAAPKKVKKIKVRDDKGVVKFYSASDMRKVAVEVEI